MTFYTTDDIKNIQEAPISLFFALKIKHKGAAEFLVA